MPLARSKQKGPNSAVGSLSAQLLDLAHKRGPGAKLPTTREICLQYGASITTLDDALADLEAKNVIFRRQGSGIFVSSTIHRKKVAVLLAYAYFRLPGASPYWNTLYHMFTMEAQRRSQIRDIDYEFIVESGAQEGSRSQDRLIAAAKQGEIHGIVEISMENSIAGYVAVPGFPIVGYAMPGDWLVIHDTEELIRLGVEALWAQGCRRIGYWSPEVAMRTKNEPFYNKTLQTFIRTLETLGGHLDVTDYLRGSDFCDTNGDIGTFQEQGFQAGMQVFVNSASKPDGILIADDMMTSGAIAAAYQHGIRLGEDIRIATQANAGSTVLFGFDKYLTLIEYSTERIVHALCDMVETLVEGKKPDQQLVSIKPTIRRSND